MNQCSAGESELETSGRTLGLGVGGGLGEGAGTGNLKSAEARP